MHQPPPPPPPQFNNTNPYSNPKIQNKLRLYIAVKRLHEKDPIYEGEEVSIDMTGITKVSEVEHALRNVHGYNDAKVMQWCSGYGWNSPRWVEELYDTNWYSYCVTKNLKRPILLDYPVSAPSPKKQKTVFGPEPNPDEQPRVTGFTNYQRQVLSEFAASAGGSQILEGFLIKRSGDWDNRHPITKDTERLLDAFSYNRSGVSLSIEYSKLTDEKFVNVEYITKVQLIVSDGTAEIIPDTGVPTVVSDDVYTVHPAVRAFRVRLISKTCSFWRFSVLDTEKKSLQDRQKERLYPNAGFIKVGNKDKDQTPVKGDGAENLGNRSDNSKWVQKMTKQLRMFKPMADGCSGFCKSPGTPEIFLAGTAESILRNIDTIAVEYEMLMRSRSA